MFHSTTDLKTSILTMQFMKNDCILAILRIAQLSGSKNRVCEHSPTYIDTSSSQNIDYISNLDEIDQLTPIQVYCGNDPSLSPILLLEETEYDIELIIKNNKVSNELRYLYDNGQSLNIRVNHFGNDNCHKIYTFYSKGYVGKGFFDIEYDGSVLKIPFEIRSKKIEYLQDYPEMLGDIASFSSALLLDYGSPLYRNYQGTYKTNKTLYEDFLILDYLFGKCNLSSTLEYVRNNKYSELISTDEEIVNGSTSVIDPSSIMAMIMSDNLVDYPNGIISGHYNPLKVVGKTSIDTYDLPENRLIKDLLLTIQSMIYSIENSDISRKSTYINYRLVEMKSLIDDYLNDQWFSDVGILTYIPYESTILQKKFGYANLFRMYQMLNVGVAFSQNDVPDLFEGHNKKIYLVYEYWCYTRLYNCLYELSDNKPTIEPIITERKKGMTIRNNRPIVFYIPFKNYRLAVHLYYNKNFDQSSNDFKSYSIKLRPDFTLVINNGQSNYIINFDAKYKLKIKNPNDVELDDSKIDTGCWEYDIYKMHTYRDALIKSLGSYVLYPGKKDDEDLWERYIKPLKPEDWNTRDEKILPSVGAISLTPGSINNNQLMKAIYTILERIPILSGTYYI